VKGQRYRFPPARTTSIYSTRQPAGGCDDRI
jgi:hypothetical protein